MSIVYCIFRTCRKRRHAPPRPYRSSPSSPLSRFSQRKILPTLFGISSVASQSFKKSAFFVLVSVHSQQAFDRLRFERQFSWARKKMLTAAFRHNFDKLKISTFRVPISNWQFVISNAKTKKKRPSYLYNTWNFHLFNDFIDDLRHYPPVFMILKFQADC